MTHKSESKGPGCKKRFYHKEDWHVVEGTHEAIVTKEIFAEVQKMTKRVGVRPVVQKGFFKCGYCGRTLNNQNLKTCSMKCRRGKLSDDTACAKVSLKNVKAMDCVLKAIQQKIRTYMDAEERRKAGLADTDPQKEIQLVQKIIESAYGLAQRARALVGTERVVIRCLFRYRRGDLVSRCGLIGQFGLLVLLELHIGVTHREARRLGESVVLLLDQFERCDRCFVMT